MKSGGRAAVIPQRVEDNAFHLSLYVLISGGGSSSPEDDGNPRRRRKIKVRRQSRTYFTNALRTTRSTLDLRLDQRRRFVFGYASVQSATKFAVAQAVEEINAQPDGKPHNKAPPRLQR